MTANPEPAQHRMIWTDRRLTIILLCMLLIVGGFEMVRFTNSLHTRATINSSAKTLEIVEKATSPEAQAQAAAGTAAIVATINDTTIVAVFCANKGGDVPSIKACVDREFAKLHPAP